MNQITFMTIAVAWLICASFTRADDALNEHGQRSVKLEELPKPPAELAPWLRRGEVTFMIGGQRPSVVDPSRSTGALGRDFDAETQFRLSYSFKSRCRWGWAENEAARRLAVDVRFDRLQLAVEHRVWLREMPDIESFWDSPLVRHELDHVRLSSDPRLKTLFVNAVDKRDRIELTIDQSSPLISRATRRLPNSSLGNRSLLNYLSGADAQPWMDAVVQEEFDKIVQLVEIRYQELDRQTEHGRQPVPREGELREWLTE
jgi:hypothetical protein